MILFLFERLNPGIKTGIKTKMFINFLLYEFRKKAGIREDMYRVCWEYIYNWIYKE